MFSFRTRLLLFLALIVVVVIVTWIYAQQTYSAFNVIEPRGPGISRAPNLGTSIAPLPTDPTSIDSFTQMPTTITTVQENLGCTLPLEYWIQNQTSIPPQIVVNFSIANRTEVCVNYAQSEICVVLEESSITPDVHLRQQFLVAIMNYLSGADPGAIGDTINAAYEWLSSHVSAASIAEDDLQAAQLYAETLRSYNQGDIGPGACAVEIVTVVRDETTVPSPTTNGTTTTLSPTLTSTPALRRTVIVTVPTSTDVPDQGPEPTQPPPSPTNTQPAPSDTSPPSPTITEVPSATATDLPTPTPIVEEDTPTPVAEDNTPTPVP